MWIRRLSLQKNELKNKTVLTIGALALLGLLSGLSSCSSTPPQETRAQIQALPSSRVLQTPDEAFLRLEPVPLKLKETLKINFNARSPVAQLELDSSVRDFVRTVTFGNAKPQEFILELRSTSLPLGERTLGYVHPKLWIERPDRKVEAIEAKSRELLFNKERKTPWWISRYAISMPQTGPHRFLISTTNRIQNQLLDPGQGRWLAVGNLSGEVWMDLKPDLKEAPLK